MLIRHLSQTHLQIMKLTTPKHFQGVRLNWKLEKLSLL